MKLILLSLFLVVSLRAMTDSEFSETYKMVDSTKLGRYIFDTLFMQMEQGSTLDRLLQTVHDLEDLYNREQKEDDETNRKYQAVCDDDIAKYDKDLAISNTIKIELEAKLEGSLYPRKEIQEGVIKSKQKEVNEYKKELDEIDNQRVAENHLYDEKVREHQEAANVIREAKRLFEENLLEPTLIEKKRNIRRVVPEVLKQVNEHFQHYTSYIEQHHKYRKSYSSLLKVLTTIASQAEATADQGSVQKIIKLCGDLLTKISQSLDLERFAEDQRLKAYQKYRHLIDHNLVVSQNILAQHVAELQSLLDKIANIKGQLNHEIERIESLTDRRKERYLECEQAAFDYKEARNDRDGQRKVVSDIIGLVNANLRGLKEQIALRVAAGDKI